MVVCTLAQPTCFVVVFRLVSSVVSGFANCVSPLFRVSGRVSCFGSCFLFRYVSCFARLLIYCVSCFGIKRSTYTRNCETQCFANRGVLSFESSRRLLSQNLHVPVWCSIHEAHWPTNQLAWSPFSRSSLFLCQTTPCEVRICRLFSSCCLSCTSCWRHCLSTSF